MAESKLAIRCISLTDSDRREGMARQLDASGHEWSFFDACTQLPDDLPYDPRESTAHHGRMLTRGELGCFASHWTLWRELAENPEADQMLVLEDDLIVDPVFFQSIDVYAAEARKYGYIRLYAKVPAGIRLESAFLDRHVARFSGRAYGTQAYFIDRETAIKYRKSIGSVVRPIDDEMDRFWAHHIPVRSIFPFPVMEIRYGSTIEATRRKGDPLSPSQAMVWRRNKALEKLRRHSADFFSRLGSV